MLHETYVILAETLSDPTPCLPPGFSGPVSTALGWVKALSLVIGVVALVRIGVHILRQQGDGVPRPRRHLRQARQLGDRHLPRCGRCRHSRRTRLSVTASC